MGIQLSDMRTERAVLGAAIIKESAQNVIGEMEEYEFYDARHKAIYRAISSLYRDGERIDLMAIRNRLIELGEMDNAGGDSYLAGLLNEFSVYNVNLARRTLLDLALRRRFAALGPQISDMLKSGVETAELQNYINNIVRQLDEVDRQEFIDIIRLYRGDVAEEYDVNGRYVKTGFDMLDFRLIGLFKGELFILAARPGCGKTALALNIAMNVARKSHVLFISLEMSIKQLGLRMLSAASMIDSDRIRRGKCTKIELDLMREKAEELKGLHMSFCEVAYTIDQIVAKIRKFARRCDLGLVVVDYLQLIQVPSKAQRYVQVGEISRRLKMLTHELDIPILCLAQVSRAAEGTAPKLSDLRESGDIEQDADVVVFISKSPEAKGVKHPVDIIIAKNRTGRANDNAEMIFDKQFTRFSDIDMAHEYGPRQ